MEDEGKMKNLHNNEEKPLKPNNKKRKEVAIFGNYRNYYGYRTGHEDDPRLKAMKKEWFEGKNCLDIGCNTGAVTVAIAQKFCCQSILGIDIDIARVGDAYWHLKKTARATTQKLSRETSKFEDSNKLNVSVGNPVESSNDDRVRDSSEESLVSGGRNLFEVVSFEKANFVGSWYPPERMSYDTIICLSVSKWVHLNWGDEGLISLFAKAWKILKPGGLFILEPQPWSSYYNNRQVSEASRANYHNIKILPEDFQDILLDKIGFRFVEDITSCAAGRKSGFERPIFAFWK
ncbi:unnamed protein product [Cuscuta epithymum]|uniref:RNA methyltransferase n=1 Tax=Cuscuta epithymum TaxID=186058 RepID=A0AAV0FZX8_9ASTE|nr:unnamed protein product [Cuscuta epithymum]